MLRLLLGTQLDVSEDFTEVEPDDPRVDQFTVYQYLSMLQNEIVDTLADALPRDGTSPVTPRLLTIMGSGETAPTMVKVHRSVVEQLGPEHRARGCSSTRPSGSRPTPRRSRRGP